MFASFLHHCGIAVRSRSARAGASVRPRRSRWRPCVEQLEERWVPASFIVTNLNDSGTGSLRDAMGQAMASTDSTSGIAFQNNLNGTISINSQLPTVSKRMITIFVGLGQSIGVSRNSSQGTFRLFQVGTGSDPSLTDSVLYLQDLTLMNGDAGNDEGGAILNRGTAHLYDCLLSGNHAATGGAISNRGSMEMDHCWVANNSADLGGGIQNWGTLQIHYNSEIYENTATGFGGGIDNTTGATLGIGDQTAIYSNTASDGGGIFNGGTLTMSDGSALSNNQAANYGGGLFNSGTATLTSVTLQGNSAGRSGGGFAMKAGGTLTLDTCTLSGNTAGRSGPNGIWQTGSTLNLINTPGDGILQVTDL
jgi:hypothetical protein